MYRRWAALLLLLAVSCVEPFRGSKIELYLRPGVQIPGDDDLGFGRPPSDTHYEVYVVKGNGAFKLAEFDIRPAIRQAEKCFIEDDTSRFPGLHSTMVLQKTRDVALEDGMVTDAEAGLIASAAGRVGAFDSLEGALKILSVHEPGLTDAAAAQLSADVPDPGMTEDSVNAERLEKCRAIFAAHPGYYVGTDKVLTIPLNGAYLGIVEGRDPRNNAFLGGAALDVVESFRDFDALRINWQFNDPADPRQPTPSSNIGYHYMAGTPIERVRGVINVSLRNQAFAQIAGEAAIYTQLNEDDVHF